MMDLVTVVYSDEISFLKTQAQSIDLYANDIDRIRVVINDDGEHDIDVAWWGRYQDRVIVTRYSDYGIPLMSCGWDQQQISKLMAAARARRWAVILDAKTWFVRSFDQSTFINNDDTISIEHQRVPKVFEHGWRWLCEFFNIPYTERIIGPGGVPFVMDSLVLADLSTTIKELTGQSLIEFFCRHVMKPYFITEFGLYSAFIEYQGWNDRYRGSKKFQAINVANGEENDFETLFYEMQRPMTLTVSIHRKARPRLSEDQYQRWSKWLASVGLNIHI